MWKSRDDRFTTLRHLSANLAPATRRTLETLFDFPGRSRQLGHRASGIGNLTTGVQQTVRVDASGQGFWSLTLDNDRGRLADSYAVGEAFFSNQVPTGDIVRSFLTFQIPELQGGQRIVGATLQVTRFAGSGNARERLGLYDVSTSSTDLNTPGGTNASIYQDLGTGDRYGRYLLETDGNEQDVLKLRLNRKAVRDLNRAKGQSFSVGGRLLSINLCNCSDAEYLFGGSDSGGVQQLVLKVD